MWLVSRNAGVCSGECFLCSTIQQKKRGGEPRLLSKRIFDHESEKKLQLESISIKGMESLKFITTGCLCKGKCSGRLIVSQKVADRLCIGIQRNQGKSKQRNQSDMDKQKSFEFCADVQLRFENDAFDDRLVFTDEATFHVNGKVNKQNVRFGE
ncbi:hypothetical protein NPIL_359751 [Nephila pilipes]|uniref:Uncharacterized protein n=1 Tax=Nephila pilipes TaxID=299642 RepID=A0A8X6PT50_NEPPI|nr:hypothetical protein NPIL_359751 [Nephila pilipes]